MRDDLYLDRTFKRRCLQIAKSMVPVDTGNLKMNAVRGRKWNDDYKFTINYSGRNAYYIEYVNEGTKNQKAQNFVFATTVALNDFLASYIAGAQKNYKKYSRNEGKMGNLELRKQVLQKSRAYYDMVTPKK